MERNRAELFERHESSYKEAFNILSDFLNNVEKNVELNVLDLASGDVPLLKFLIEEGKKKNIKIKATCIDIDESLNIEQENLELQNINVIDFVKNGKNKNKQDLIILNAALHEIHSLDNNVDLIEKKKEFLFNLIFDISDLLYPEGKIFIGDYYYDDDLKDEDFDKYRSTILENGGHCDERYKFFKYDDVKQILKSTGVKIIKQKKDYVDENNKKYYYSFLISKLTEFTLHNRLQEFENNFCNGKTNANEFLKHFTNLLYFNTEYKSLKDSYQEYSILTKLSKFFLENDINSKCTLWLNYQTKLINEKLKEIDENSNSYINAGRFSNEDEIVFKYDESVVKTLNKNDGIKKDVSTYWFYNLITDEKIRKKEIISMHELLEKDKSIEIIKFSKDVGSKIKFTVIKYDGDSINGNITNDFETLKNALNIENDEPLISYTEFLKKILKKNKVNKERDFIPKYFYIHNLSLPFSSEYKGSLMLFSVDEINDLKQKIQPVKNIFETINRIENKYLHNRFVELIRKKNIQTATTAIMARNISHNLGSHVIFYIITALETFNLIHEFPHIVELEKTGDKKFILKHIKDIKIELEKLKDDEIQSAPFLRGLIRFLGYIQERHDYIASISNDYIPYFGEVNFKDFIFDTLLPDDRHKRHLKEDNKVKNLIENNLLLDYIAKSEKIDRQDIKIYFKKIGSDDSFDSSDSDNLESEPLKFLRSIEVSLPGSVLGRQAFFSIFENFIRNSAKHNKSKKLDIYIAIDEKQHSDFYTINLYDTSNQISKSDFDGIKDKKFIEPYINEDDGSLIESNKGIKEIRISAAFLRGLKVQEIDDEQNLIFNNENIGPLVNVKRVDNVGNDTLDEKNGCLCYEFKIPKSKKCVFIVDNNLKKPSNFNQDYDVKNVDEFNSGLKNYKLIVLDRKLDRNLKEKFKVYNQERVIEYSMPKKYKFNNLYKKFIDNFYGSKTDEYTLIVEDDHVNEKEEEGFYLKKTFSKTADSKDFGKWETVLKNSKNIVFRTHNDTSHQFNSFKENLGKDKFNNIEFLEGISGNNSTDRLIRKEKTDDYWRLRLIESSLNKIAIIDERIFDKYKFLNNISIIENDKINIFIDRLWRDKSNINIKDIKDIEEELLGLFDKDVKSDMNFRDIIDSILNINSYDETDFKIDFLLRIKQITESKINSDTENKNKAIQKEIFEKKSINIYDIKINNGKFHFFDLSLKKIDKPNPTDFVFIHQTILEELYKENTNIINDLKMIFKPYRKTTRIIAHSGRSKPDKLLKDTGFVLFSSLTSALSDCKFSLSELAFNTHIENK